MTPARARRIRGQATPVDQVECGTPPSAGRMTRLICKWVMQLQVPEHCP